jgi:hypothetical protein
MVRLGRLQPPSESDRSAAIPAERAIQIARAQAYDWPDPSPYLAHLTEAGTGTPEFVWIVRFKDMDFAKGGPMPETGPPTVIVYSYAYVLVDARSGAFLSTTYLQ